MSQGQIRLAARVELFAFVGVDREVGGLALVFLGPSQGFGVAAGRILREVAKVTHVAPVDQIDDTCFSQGSCTQDVASRSPVSLGGAGRAFLIDAEHDGLKNQQALLIVTALERGIKVTWVDPLHGGDVADGCLLFHPGGPTTGKNRQ